MVSSFKNIVVKVHTEEGPVGLGECDVLSVAGDIDDAGRRMQALAGRVIGMDPCDIEAVVARLEAPLQPDLGVVAAFDIACWDLAGKLAGMPAYKLLGGEVQARVPVDFTLGQDQPQAMGRCARSMREEWGFGGFCVKVGGHGPLEDDVARVRTVREMLGPEPKLRLDANGAFDLESAIDLLHRVEAFDVEFVEQPLPAGDLEDLRRLAAEVAIPISVDEGLRTLDDAFRLAASGAVSVFNIKLPRCGGIHLGKKIAAIAEAAGIDWICGGGLAFEIVRQASRHFAVSTPARGERRYHHEGPGPASQGLLADVVRPVVTYADVGRAGGTVGVTDLPGLGVEEDVESLARHQEGGFSIPAL
jgi:L-Ala-D/L-Glu epimerase